LKWAVFLFEWTGCEELPVLFPHLGLPAYPEDGNKAGFIRVFIRISKTRMMGEV
jgi:hypothetical protein